MQEEERNLNAERDELSRSLLKFMKHFYYLRTGRKFELSFPDGRESHYLIICRALIGVMRGETTRLLINVPPRYG